MRTLFLDAAAAGAAAGAAAETATGAAAGAAAAKTMLNLRHFFIRNVNFALPIISVLKPLSYVPNISVKSKLSSEPDCSGSMVVDFSGSVFVADCSGSVVVVDDRHRLILSLSLLQLELLPGSVVVVDDRLSHRCLICSFFAKLAY